MDRRMSDITERSAMRRQKKTDLHSFNYDNDDTSYLKKLLVWLNIHPVWS